MFLNKTCSVQGYNENRNQGLDYKGKTTFMSNYDFVSIIQSKSDKEEISCQKNFKY